MSCAEEPPMRAYSTDLRERLVRAVADGQCMREAARRFGAAATIVKCAVVQERAISGEQDRVLRVWLEAAPDATALEHCAWWAEL